VLWGAADTRGAVCTSDSASTVEAGRAQARQRQLEVAVVVEPELLESGAAGRLHGQTAGRAHQGFRPAVVMEDARDAQAVAAVLPQLVGPPVIVP